MSDDARSSGSDVVAATLAALGLGKPRDFDAEFGPPLPPFTRKAIIPPGTVYADVHHKDWRIDRNHEHIVATPPDGDRGNWVESKALVEARTLEQAHVPEDLTSMEALAVIRALAERFPEHVVVVSDEVQARTSPEDAKAWRHPEDVEAIEQTLIEQVFWEDGTEALRHLHDRVPLWRWSELVNEAAAREAAETNGHTPIADRVRARGDG